MFPCCQQALAAREAQRETRDIEMAELSTKFLQVGYVIFCQGDVVRYINLVSGHWRRQRWPPYFSRCCSLQQSVGVKVVCAGVFRVCCAGLCNQNVY